MKVTSERLQDSQVLLRIEIEAERAEKSIDQAYRKLANRLSIPGFRKGKAPRHVIERVVGRDALVQESIDLMLPQVYREAVNETGIQPVAEPHVDIVQQEPLVMTMTVPVRPTVELGDYRDVRVEPEEARVPDSDADVALQQLREQNAEWLPVGREVQAGDRVTMDVTAHVRGHPVLYNPQGEAIVETPSGEPLIDQKGAEYTVDVDNPAPVKGFAEKLIGHKVGEEFRFELSFPANHPDRKLANKAAIYQVKLAAVKEKQLPALDDEFAKTVGDHETLAALRESVANDLRRQAEQEARKRLEDRVLSIATDQARIEMPEALIEREIGRISDRTEQRLKQARVGIEDYLRAANKTEEDLRADYRTDAIGNLRRYLVLEEIAKIENVEVTPDEVDAEIKKIEQAYGEYGERVTANMRTPEGRADLTDDLRRRKALNRLVDIATGKTGEPEPSQQATPSEATSESEAE